MRRANEPFGSTEYLQNSSVTTHSSPKSVEAENGLTSVPTQTSSSGESKSTRYIGDQTSRYGTGKPFRVVIRGKLSSD